MKKIFPLIVVLLAIGANAQTQQKVFFNKNRKKCDEKSAYVYQFTEDPETLNAPGFPANDSDTVVTLYFAVNNRVCMELRCAQGYAHGPYKLYYENGNLKEEGFRGKNQPEGKVMTYYPTGRIQEIIDYPEESLSQYHDYNFLILEYRDSSGVQMVKDGNGICRRYFFMGDSTRGEVRREEGLLKNGLRDLAWRNFSHDTLCYQDKFSNGKFIEGVRYDKGKEIHYTEVEKQPEFNGGMEDLIKFISRNLRYPTDARRFGVDGKAFVQFVVLKDGVVTDVEVIKGVSPSIDEEAARVVASMPNWIPGMQRGKPVKAMFVLPIRFKLDVGRSRR